VGDLEHVGEVVGVDLRAVLEARPSPALCQPLLHLGAVEVNAPSVSLDPRPVLDAKRSRPWTLHQRQFVSVEVDRGVVASIHACPPFVLDFS